MTSIPLLVETIECEQFIIFQIFSKKKFDPPSLCISEITDHERRA